MTATIIPYEDASSMFERDKKVFHLRLAGVSPRRIAEELSCSLDQVEQSLDRMTGGVSPALRQRTILMELERLDALQKVHYANALNGQIGATLVVVKLMERRSRYLGLDAPVRTDDPLGGAGQRESSTEGLLRELDRIAAERGPPGSGPIIEAEVVPESAEAADVPPRT